MAPIVQDKEGDFGRLRTRWELPAELRTLFTEHHKTPWGNGINYDGDRSKAVREFVIQNAIYWIKEFRLDGLRPVGNRIAR